MYHLDTTILNYLLINTNNFVREECNMYKILFYIYIISSMETNISTYIYTYNSNEAFSVSISKSLNKFVNKVQFRSIEVFFNKKLLLKDG